MTKNIIYYFTGTGNSLKAAKDIADNLNNTKIISIAKNFGQATIKGNPDTVGFVFPVYYCGLPQIVLEFITQLDLSQISYIYIAATYGSMAGNAGCISQTNRILKNKGKILNAGFYIKSVDNFILWTWDITAEEKHEYLHTGVQQKAEQIADIVSQKKHHIDRSITEHIGPYIFRYQHFVNTVTTDDKTFLYSEKCTSCGICDRVCPTQNIEMRNGHPCWKSETCQRCLACLHLCPMSCIQYGKITIKRHRYNNPYITINELSISTNELP